MSEELKRPEAEYLEKKAAIRRDRSVSWEKQEKAIKALGEDYHARRRELEEAA